MGAPELIYRTIESLPKVLLHAHLEGGLRPNTISSLCNKYRIDLPFKVDGESISSLVRKGGWDIFLSIFTSICHCLKQREDFYDALVDYGKHLSDQNVIYAELHLSVSSHMHRGVCLLDIEKGLTDGIDYVNKKHGVTIKLIIDFVRDGKEDVERLIDWALDLSKNYVVGIGISGGPNSIPRPEYFRHCTYALRKGLNIVAHAGELEGAASVHEAFYGLHATRISHGIRSLEDAKLFNELVSQKVHFELCPTSNIHLGVQPVQMPSIRQIIKSGASYSINTDDELLFNTDINKEICKLVKNNMIKFDDIFMVQSNSIAACFANTEEKARLHNNLKHEWDKVLMSMDGLENYETSITAFNIDKVYGIAC